MPLPYRTVLHLPPSTDLVRIAEQELQSWLEAKKKVDVRHRDGLSNGRFFEPGVHSLGKGRSLAVAHLEQSDRAGRQLLMRFTEESKSGIWQIDMLVLDSSEASQQPDTLLIEGKRVDAPDAEGQVDPPTLVSRLLARETVLDSRTPVTSEPQMIGLSAVDDVFDAITDERRSVTVIVASSLGRQFDERTREVVRQLTSKVTGLASVFVLTSESTEALNRRLPSSHRVEAGRVRTFLPRVDLESSVDGRRHRVLGPQTFARAIRGRRVADWLQRSFAIQTRSALMASPLPRALRRQWSQLDDQLTRQVREADVERQVADAVQASRERSGDVVGVPALDRLVRMFARWLGRDVEEIDNVAADELDAYVDRHRIEAESAKRTVLELQEKLQRARETNDVLLDEFEYRGLEVAEAERSASQLTDRVKYLQNQLREAGKAAEAHMPLDDSTWETPSDLSELALRLTPGTSDHPVVQRVVFTGDFDRVVETDARDQNGLYVQRCWDFVRVLHDYAELKVGAGFAGNVHGYLNDDSHDGFKVTLTRHAGAEAKSTMEQWGGERIFPVPSGVDPGGKMVMEAHFKAGQQNTFAPRMYYFDDTANSGKIYVGYIGKHLTNTKTKNT